MARIRLYNTLTRRKEEFVPLVDGRVGMYLCGPTVYDRAHLGNARNVILFDVLFRLMRHEYGPDAVTYVRNFTDVDDKINARAAESGRPISDITAETTRWYHEDMDALGALRPTHEPRATEHIPGMIAMIERLIDRGHAYEVAGHVLFDVRSYPEYGRLSGRSVDDMIAGARVEVAPFKRDPMDFVLWKPSDPSLPGWDSPWGRGRPGWHIECSAMSLALLGAEFDIHGGGLDLTFPHHENEIAQSRCAHPEGGFARVWLHNEMLLVEGKKMSKSLGNFFTVRDLLDKGVPGEVIRYVFLMTHYRSPMDWTEQKRREAEAEIEQWVRTLSVRPDISEAEADVAQPDPEILLALSDDLNTSLALSRLKALARKIDNSSAYLALSQAEQHALDRVFVASADLLGFDLIALARAYRARVPAKDLEHFTLSLVYERAKARENNDFSEVDRLRSALIAAGVEVRMSKTDVELVPGPGFDLAKLEALQ